MRRLNQRIAEIAKLPLNICELKLRRLQANAGRRLGADPAMHVIVEHVGPRTTEIASAAGAERRNHGEQ
jgi:hypothetical protein